MRHYEYRSGDEGFTASTAPCLRVGGRLCPNGKRRRRKEIASRSRASPRHCHPSFHLPSCLGRSTARSCRRRLGWRSIPIGARIRYAPIAWRAPLLPAAERRAAGPGGSAAPARTDYQPHSERHPRPIANAHTRGVPDSAVCAGNRFIALAGMSICGTPAPTIRRSGTAPAWSHGNSGTRRVARPGSCGACRRDVAAKLAGGYGRAPRWTIASRCFGCGANFETRHGQSCWIIGVCPTFRRSTAMSMPRNARPRHAIDARPAILPLNSSDWVRPPQRPSTPLQRFQQLIRQPSTPFPCGAPRPAVSGLEQIPARSMAAVARLLGLAKFGVGAVTYAEPPDPVFGRRLRRRGTFGRKDIAMQSKRIALIVLPALLLGATTAAAQIPPPVPPLVPNPNPSSSLVLPAPHEVPVSPVTPGTLPGSTAPGVGDTAGIYATQPMGVFHHHHRRRLYSR